MSDFELKFKDTIEFVKNSNISSPNKPAIPHALRVGEYLFNKGCNDDVVNAGLLHDLLEWSSISRKELESQFGEAVIKLVQANTKDKTIEDKSKRRLAQIQNCLEVGDDALAIKISDNYDSFKYYSSTENESELQRCRDWSELLLEHISDRLKELFKQELEEIKKTA